MGIIVVAIVMFPGGGWQRGAYSSGGKATEATKEDLASAFAPDTRQAGAPGHDERHPKEEASQGSLGVGVSRPQIDGHLFPPRFCNCENAKSWGSTVRRPSGEDDEARWVQALTPAHRTLGRLGQARALLEDEFTGEALRRFDPQALAAMPERARDVLEVAGDFFLADPDTGREFPSRERTLPEYLPERRPYRCVSLG